MHAAGARQEEGTCLMVHVGIDIAKNDHVACAVDESGGKLTRPLPFKNNEAGFEKLLAWLEGIVQDPSEAFVGMEATGHYWMACFSFLTSAGYACCVVNPMQVRAVRELKSMPRVKNDRVDSWLIAETLKRGSYEQTRLADDDVQALRMLTRYQQSLKQELATVKTQCICVMDACFPEYAALFSNMFGAASLAVLASKPTPAEISRAHTKTLAETLSSASRGRLGADKAAELKAAAKSSVGVRIGQEAASFQVKTMVAQVEFLNATIEKVEAEVRVLLERVEPLVLTIPGVSHTTGAQIVAEIGDVRRFKNASAIVKYAGLNSGVSQSGKFEAKGEPITKKGSPYLRRSLWLAANRARQHDPKMRAYYNKLKASGKCHRVAVTACARKLCHIVFAVMRDQAPYDPEK